MIPFQYVWFTWASVFLVPWVLLYLWNPRLRQTMWQVSLATAPFGLTEPLFVPEYWNPPTLFDLAQRTGFDLESLIFCFGIGGVGSVLYLVCTRNIDMAVCDAARQSPLHRHHYKALATPVVVFLLLYFLPWNPIYPAIFAMLIGALATMACRPDLKTKTWIGGALFLAYYTVFFLALKLSAPGYVLQVWNFRDITGYLFLGIPIEELLFAFTFGMYWSGIYEHFMWQRIKRVSAV